MNSAEEGMSGIDWASIKWFEQNMDDMIPTKVNFEYPRLVWLVTWYTAEAHGIVGICSSQKLAGAMAKRRSELDYQEDVVIRSVMLDKDIRHDA